MSRTIHPLLVCLICLTCLLTVLQAVDVDIDADPLPPGATRPALIPAGITIQIASHLLDRGKPLYCTVDINNPGRDMDGTLVTRVSNLFGCVFYTKRSAIALPAREHLVQQISFAGSDRLANGVYLVEAWVEGDVMGYGMTQVGIWNGAWSKTSPNFGISYAGPLDSERTWRDLDMFTQAGINWLRLPLRGWSPDGGALPAQTTEYDVFVREAVSKRKFNLLAAFIPSINDDPLKNPALAAKQYRESLVAAATKYKPQIRNWELLRVLPNANYAELRGIKYSHLKAGREGLRTLDKGLTAIYTLEYPCRWNARELFSEKIPGAGDYIGMQYNFVSTPEANVTPTQPINDVDDIRANAKSTLKRVPPMWVTEYGLDPSRGGSLPSAIYQAAVVSRAIILDRVNGIERTFWRHNPDSLYDLPFTTNDGGPQPSLLAVRTTLESLDGVTGCGQIPAPLGVRAYLFKFDPEKKAADAKPRYLLATWVDQEVPPCAVAIKTRATQITTWDLWGNQIDLRPTNNIAIFQADEFPRFVDMGEFGDVDQLRNSCINLNPSRIVLRKGAKDEDNSVMILLRNDLTLIPDIFSCDLRFTRLSDGVEGKPETVKFVPYARDSIKRVLEIPEGAEKGMIYEVGVEIKIGTRLIGYLTLPVFYDPKESAVKGN